MIETNEVRIKLAKVFERHVKFVENADPENVHNITSRGVSAVISILGDHWREELRNHEHPIVDEILND